MTTHVILFYCYTFLLHVLRCLLLHFYLFGFTAQILGLDIIIGCISHQAWQAVLLGLNILMHIYPIWIEICITFSSEETNYNSLFKIRSK